MNASTDPAALGANIDGLGRDRTSAVHAEETHKLISAEKVRGTAVYNGAGERLGTVFVPAAAGLARRQLGRQLALLGNALQHGLAALGQLAQIGQAILVGLGIVCLLSLFVALWATPTGQATLQLLGARWDDLWAFVEGLLT